jgi:hypothetical protein
VLSEGISLLISGKTGRFIALMRYRSSISWDPADETVSTAPASVPGRSYKMGTATKRWLTFDHSPEERESLLRQVAEAESERKAAYTITVPSAWYEIEYGLVKASGKTEA